MTQPGESFSCSVSPVWVLPHATQLLSCEHCGRFSHNGGTDFKSRSCHTCLLCESGRPGGGVLSESSVAAGHPLTSLSWLRRDMLPALQLTPQSYVCGCCGEVSGEIATKHFIFGHQTTLILLLFSLSLLVSPQSHRVSVARFRGLFGLKCMCHYKML